mmetsp:Transcript_3976/g.5573  ORF Transcript_3976/g.5573 Transcript_3976/m.5573 type:complete len:219 (-) Transcript_3976:425-1081(-)
MEKLGKAFQSLLKVVFKAIIVRQMNSRDGRYPFLQVCQALDKVLFVVVALEAVHHLSHNFVARDFQLNQVINKCNQREVERLWSNNDFIQQAQQVIISLFWHQILHNIFNNVSDSIAFDKCVLESDLLAVMNEGCLGLLAFLEPFLPIGLLLSHVIEFQAVLSFLFDGANNGGHLLHNFNAFSRVGVTECAFAWLSVDGHLISSVIIKRGWEVVQLLL